MHIQAWHIYLISINIYIYYYDMMMQNQDNCMIYCMLISIILCKRDLRPYFFIIFLFNRRSSCPVGRLRHDICIVISHC